MLGFGVDTEVLSVWEPTGQCDYIDGQRSRDVFHSDSPARTKADENGTAVVDALEREIRGLKLMAGSANLSSDLLACSSDT